MTIAILPYLAAYASVAELKALHPQTYFELNLKTYKMESIKASKLAESMEKLKIQALKEAEKPSPLQLQLKVVEFSMQITLLWRKLGEIHKEHGQVISKQWTKKTINKRRDILLNVMPEIALTHRPDLRALLARKYQPSEPYY